MKKDNLVRGNLAYKDGKTEFIQDSRGKFWLNPATGKIQKGRPWILRKVHFWLWDFKEFGSGLLLQALSITLVVPAGLGILIQDDEYGIFANWRVVFGYISIALLALYYLSKLVKEPKDDCDC